MHQDQDPLIRREIIAFIIDRRARQRSERTIQFYEDELRYFADWLQSQGIIHLTQIYPKTIRRYLIALSETRNKGGIHAAFRAIRAWLNWWEAESEDDDWRNPIRKVKPPSPSKEPLPGISQHHVHALIAATAGRHFTDKRDRALIFFLIDTGVRKSELAALNFGDIDLETGEVQVRSGKGDKDRAVFLGARARRELIRYLRKRGQLVPNNPLWVTYAGRRLTSAGIRQVIRRRSEQVGIPAPGMHDFRRYFAIECLRNGMDLETLRRLMGHTSLTVLQRYLYIIKDDLARLHGQASPGDNL